MYSSPNFDRVFALNSGRS